MTPQEISEEYSRRFEPELDRILNGGPPLDPPDISDLEGQPNFQAAMELFEGPSHEEDLEEIWRAEAQHAAREQKTQTKD